MLCRAGTFKVLSPGEVFVLELDGQVLDCVDTSQGGHSYLPYELSPSYPRKRKKCPPPSYRLFGSAFPSPSNHTLLSSVPGGEGRTA